jgi:hypothetical protein
MVQGCGGQFTQDKKDKVGLGKCPHNNSRACIEIIQRVNATNFDI